MPPVSNSSSFHLEARSQRVCAVCQKATVFEAHHVVEKQELRRRGEPKFDTRNALRLCKPLHGKNCHSRHTTGTRRVKVSELTVDNLDYAFEVLGAYAYDYLRSFYADDDGRLAERLALTGEAVAFP